MYCGTCLHDNTLAAGLLELGQDVLLVPTYTPLRTDETDVSLRRVFFGGINVYLQQKWPLFRHTPRFVDRLLDRPALLGWVARRAISTNPQELGDLTVSMLRGEQGRQRKELDQLVSWLADEARPDIVHLSNALLLGMARQISRRLNVRVVTTLSGEDAFLEKLPEPHYSTARELLRERAGDAAAFVALNRYYADAMARCLAVPIERIEVIPHGLNLAGHGRSRLRRGDDQLVIGYFARVCHDKGLHLFVEALRLLAANDRLPPWRARAAGYLSPADRSYLADIQRQVRAWGLADRFEYLGEVDRAGKIEFLQSLHLMSVPTVYRESKGISVFEALANGVPVVLPEHGTFPEVIADTGGGLLFRPGDPADLADKLARLMLDSDLRTACGERGLAAVHDRYHHRVMARRHLDLYKRILAHGGPKPAAAISSTDQQSPSW